MSQQVLTSSRLHQQRHRRFQHLPGGKGPASVVMMAGLDRPVAQTAHRGDTSAATRPPLLELRHLAAAWALQQQPLRRQCGGSAAYQLHRRRWLHRLPCFMSARRVCWAALRCSPPRGTAHHRWAPRRALPQRSPLGNVKHHRRHHRGHHLAPNGRVQLLPHHQGCLLQLCQDSDQHLWRCVDQECLHHGRREISVA